MILLLKDYILVDSPVVESLLYLQYVGLGGVEPTLRTMQSFQLRAETPKVNI